jgi:Holliday junction resolvasome RuvABC endonuclease subunit
MNKTPLRILSINPGSRYLGIAVFKGIELYDCAVKVVKGNDFRQKAAFVRSIIQDHIDRYGINVLALKNLHPNRSSHKLQRLISETKRISQTHKLILFESSIDEVKAGLLSTARANKCRLMEEIAVRYPFLLSEMGREQKNKNPYLIRMFEAIATGLVCFNNLDSGKEKVGSNNK